MSTVPTTRAKHLGLRQPCCRFPKAALLPPNAKRHTSHLKFLLRLGLLIILHSSFVIPTRAGTSANYTLSPDATDAGGLRGTSASYTLNSSAMPGSHGTSANYMARTGFAGQLADAIATAIDITASPLTIDESGTRQLGGTLIFDDLSTASLDPSTITWSIDSGPVASISASGLANASAVYQDTGAVVRGTYQSLTDTLSLTVLNTLPDNFASYAADGIDDAWQVQYFGQPPNALAAPAIDPDYDGQDNLFEFTAGLIPTDATSFFHINIAPVDGQPSQKRIIFSPRFIDRTYTVQTSTTLLPLSWQPLGASTTSDAGTVRFVTDINATGSGKFYRVEITRP